jgi:hypothetical protein
MRLRIEDVVIETDRRQVFVGDERMRTRRALVPDQAVSFGPARTLLHAAPPAGSTEERDALASPALSTL